MDPQTLEIDLDLIAKLDRSGPRYTSYPTADRFTETFDSRVYAAWAARRNSTGIVRPLSLYLHLPFCSSLCYYCACNKVVTRDARKAAGYLRHLKREIALQSALFRDDARVEQMHWGGGAPTFYGLDALAALFRSVGDAFELAPDGEYSIEIDPRTVKPDSIRALRDTGFNRVSFGMQDFDPRVQQAVNRIQSEAETAALVAAARATGFASINVDLIYGLPYQTAETFGDTLRRVAALRPDRVAVYSYAHRPARFRAQTLIKEDALPPAGIKMSLLGLAAQRLTDAGYVYIGMDHLALPDDALAVAQREGRLRRNFQGYSTRGDCDVVGLGVSAIGAIGPVYSQNTRTLADYRRRLDRNEVPVARGFELSRDDLVRRSVIGALMCQFQISRQTIGARYLIDFDEYFSPELEELKALGRDGLLEFEGDWISVTPRGRMLIRNVCMVFDRYLRGDREKRRYSRTV